MKFEMHAADDHADVESESGYHVVSVSCSRGLGVGSRTTGFRGSVYAVYAISSLDTGWPCRRFREIYFKIRGVWKSRDFSKF